MAEEKGTQQGGLIVGALGGGLAGVFLGTIMSKPAAAATPELKLEYLIELLESLVVGNAAIIEWLTKINSAQGVPGVPGVEVTVLTPWKAREPETIFEQAIRSAGTFFSDRMVDYRNAKRFLLKVESSLDQACQIQVIGNITDSFLLVTDIGPAIPCAANDNISVGLAWDDWNPFIGVRITTAIAPTAGILNIWGVIQE